VQGGVGEALELFGGGGVVRVAAIPTLTVTVIACPGRDDFGDRGADVPTNSDMHGPVRHRHAPAGHCA